MSKKFWVIAAALAVTAGASTAVVQADDGAPAQAAGKISPPPIHEPFGGSNLLPCKKDDGTTQGIEGCVEHQILKSDQQIEELNSSISSGLGSARMQRKFVAGHSAWLTYRNTDCNSMASIYEGGSLESLTYAQCLESRNKRRIGDLRDFRRGPEG
jgi:uncharacterized protein YecT (DUF1311 family)